MLSLMDWFCGAGGSSQGAAMVPGVEVTRAANHWERAIETHAANFPGTDHYQGDIRVAPVNDWPVTDLFWASPECPQWSSARGRPRDYHTQDTLPGLEPDIDIEAERSRALMEEVPMYLAGAQRRGRTVLAGVVENVVEVRAWAHWDRWIHDIRNLGYHTRVIALNSMHAWGTRTPRAPQSRDRLYLAYWHRSLGRSPDWDKWLRPVAECPNCGPVHAVQSWKRPGVDMGRYRASYVYRCPAVSCRGRAVEPSVLPALAAIDPTIPAQRIGDRSRPLADKTMRRIQIGAERYWRPILTGAVPPLMVPVEGRDGKQAAPANIPYRTQTARNETGIAVPPVVVTLRGGGSQTAARPATEPVGAVSAGGMHHGLAVPPDLLVPYYGRGNPVPATEPVGTLPTRDRYAVASPAIDLADVRFRMLEPAEIGRAMAFQRGYTVIGSKRDRVRQYGNAVTPPVAEVLVSALVEAITGEELERREWTTAA